MLAAGTGWKSFNFFFGGGGGGGGGRGGNDKTIFNSVYIFLRFIL